MDAHEITTASGIAIPDPDQGTPYILGQCAMPSTTLMIWEPFEDGTKGGHNLFSFKRRWEAWKASDEEFLQVYEPRFGFPSLIPRAALDYVVQFSIAYHRKDDVRAGVRLARPEMRTLADGAIEVRVPR